MSELELAIVDGVKTTKLDNYSTNWSDFVELMQVPIVVKEDKARVELDENYEPRAQALLFVPCHMVSTNDDYVRNEWGFYSRCDNNVLSRQLMVLDFDNGNPLHLISKLEIEDTFSDYEYILYSSYNNLKPKYKFSKKIWLEPVEKYRLIIPLETPCPPLDWKKRIKDMVKRWPSADHQQFKLSQPFYVSCVETEYQDKFFVNYNKGRKFDWKNELSPVNEQTTRPTVFNDTQLEEGDRNVIITTSKFGQVGIVELYHLLTESQTTPCFAFDRVDNKPGCYVKRKNGYLTFYDNNASSSTRYWKIEEENKSLVLVKGKKKDDSIDKVRTLTKERQKAAADELKQMLTVVNERYLSEHELNDVGIIFIKSPKGTGKTVLIENLVNEHKTSKTTGGLLAITHRINLGYSLTSRTGINHYLDEPNPVKQWLISIDSITKAAEQTSIRYSTIIIDEVEQVLRHLTSGTLIDKRAKVFSSFVKLIRQANRIILLDADISSRLTFEVISSFRYLPQRDKVQGIINEYKPGGGRVIDLFGDKGHLIYNLQECLARPDSNVFIATNSKNFTNELGVICKDVLNEEAEILVVNADTAKYDKRVQQFIKNPEEESTLYRAIISSPTLGTGVSVDGTHFNHVYGFFDRGISTYFDIDQAVSRVRNTNAAMKIWIHDTRDNDEIFQDELKRIHLRLVKDDNFTKEEAEQELAKLRKAIAAKEFNYNTEEGFNYLVNQYFESAKRCEEKTRINISGHKINFTEDELLWFKTYATLEVEHLTGLIQRKQKYIDYVKDNNFVVREIDINSEAAELGKKQLKIHKQNYNKQLAINICAADDITEEQFKELEKLLKKSKEQDINDNYRFQKHLFQKWLKDISDCSKITPDIAEQMLARQFFSNYKHLVYAIRESNFSKEIDYDNRLNNDKAATDLHHAHQFNEHTNNCVRYFPEFKSVKELYQSLIEKQLTVDQAVLQKIAEYYKSNMKELNTLTGQHVKNPTTRPLFAWNALFEGIGLKMNAKLKKYTSTERKLNPNLPPSRYVYSLSSVKGTLFTRKLIGQKHLQADTSEQSAQKTAKELLKIKLIQL